MRVIDSLFRTLLEEVVDHEGTTRVLLRTFALVHHHLSRWESIHDSVKQDIAARAAFFNQTMYDHLRARMGQPARGR